MLKCSLLNLREEERFGVAVSWSKGKKHQFYEDRYRILTRDIPIVLASIRGELFGVFDSIGCAPRGMSAAQTMADALIKFYRKPDRFDPSFEAVHRLLLEGNMEIRNWGVIPPDGHFKIPHPWPGQNPPATEW